MVNLNFSKEELEQMYLKDNKSFKEVAEICGVTGPQLRVVLNFYGITKPRSQVKEVTKRVTLERYGVESINQLESVKNKKKQVFLERYGVDNPGGIPSIREKNIARLKDPEIIRKRIEAVKSRTPEDWSNSTKKAMKTKEKRYGKNYNKIFREKAKQTLVAKYGVPYSIEGREKMKQTNLKRYGVEQYSQSKEAKEQIKKTKFERYGGWFNQEAIQKTKLERYGDPHYNNREKARITNKERFGVDWYCTLASEDSPTVASRPNEKFAEFLNENGICYEREFELEGKRYDFKVGNYLIEINPSATHNSTFGIRNNPKPGNYHIEKSHIAWKNGYECIHVWDWVDWKDVLNIVTSNIKTFYNLSSPEDKEMFLQTNLNFFSGKELEQAGLTRIEGTEELVKFCYDLRKGQVLSEIQKDDKNQVVLWVPGTAYYYCPDKEQIVLPEGIKICNIHLL